MPAALARIEARTLRPHRYDLPPALVPTLWGGRFRGQEQTWFRMTFLGTDADVDISGTGHDAEFAEWAWMAPADLVERIVPFKRDLYRAVLAELDALGPPPVAARRAALSSRASTNGRHP